jgi:hypothetical protein
MPPTTGRNRWTHEQRVCLHMLWNHEQKPSLSERTRTFNHIFKDHLEACYVPGSRLEPSTLNCQYAERTYRHKATWRATWENVCFPPGTDEDRALRARLAAEIAKVLRRGESVEAAIDVSNMPDTPPETPRRTDRVRKVTQNPYDSYADPDPTTPVRQYRPSARDNVTAAPYATPGPSTRKRPATAPSRFIVEGDLDELNDDDVEHTLGAKRPRRISPDVVIQPSSEIVLTNTIITPIKSRYRSGPRKGATRLLHRFDGAPIWLTPAEYAEAMLPLVNVTEEAAHPNPPALLFRFWHAKSHGINSETGFVSGRFSRILVEPRGPPDCDVLEVSELDIDTSNQIFLTRRPVERRGASSEQRWVSLKCSKYFRLLLTCILLLYSAMTRLASRALSSQQLTCLSGLFAWRSSRQTSRHASVSWILRNWIQRLSTMSRLFIKVT